MWSNEEGEEKSLKLPAKLDVNPGPSDIKSIAQPPEPGYFLTLQQDQVQVQDQNQGPINET